MPNQPTVFHAQLTSLIAPPGGYAAAATMPADQRRPRKHPRGVPAERGTQQQDGTGRLDDREGQPGARGGGLRLVLRPAPEHPQGVQTQVPDADDRHQPDIDNLGKAGGDHALDDVGGHGSHLSTTWVPAAGGRCRPGAAAHGTHPAVDRFPQAAPVGGNSRRVEPASAVADFDGDALPDAPGRDPGSTGVRVPGHVGQGLGDP